MLKKILVGSIVCLLSVILLGCQPITKTDDWASKPNNDTPVIAENEANSKPDSKPDVIKPVAFSEVKGIALEAAKKAKNTVPGWAGVEIENIKHCTPGGL